MVEAARKSFSGVLRSYPSVQTRMFVCELKIGSFPCFEMMLTICFMRSLEAVSFWFFVVFGKFVCGSCLLISILARLFSFIVAIVVSIFSVMLKLEKSLTLNRMLLKGMDCLVLIILQFSVDPGPTPITHSRDAGRAFDYR
jgi:hypothetical protein